MAQGKIAENIAELRKSIHLIARQCGRRPEEISFILVTKTVPVSVILEALEAGISEFGENRVQELLAKKKELGKPALWHMIGHLQTNKVKQVLGEAALIHSLDREDLAEEIGEQAGLKGLKQVPCLIQVNSSGEASKFGLKPEEVSGFVEGLNQIPSIQIKGLMTIGPNVGNRGQAENSCLSPVSAENQIRKAFRRTRELQQELKKSFPEIDFGILSMGMSGDYKIAIEEGATLLRIGTAVFGERK
ncbi:MAG: YggS family pyridoxal phosphate-dependent enzyme [Candidatus Omnitrophica bacterium]|nr:YggS family pyridoxal phosphate-dependent enzyme [Candidatus Omnitrophota bacterium]